MSLRSIVSSFLLLALALGAWTGCSHYQLGTGAKPSFASLYVEPVENQTLVPQARAILTTRIREALIRDDRVSVVNSPDAADATLQVTIRDYRREVASVQERDTGLARKFTLSLRVTCTLVDRRTGKPLFTNRELHVERDAFTDSGQFGAQFSGQLQAEYQMLPLMAEALGQRVAATVLDVW